MQEQDLHHNYSFNFCETCTKLIIFFMSVTYMLEKNEGPLIVRYKLYLCPLNQACYLYYFELPFLIDFFRLLNPTLIENKWLKSSKVMIDLSISLFLTKFTSNTLRLLY